MCNGLLISAHGRLNWSDNLKVGLESELICSEYLCKHQSPFMPQSKTLGTESASNQTVDIPGKFIDQAPVVQKVDNAIHRINHYSLDIAIGFAITYPVDSDLSGG